MSMKYTSSTVARAIIAFVYIALVMALSLVLFLLMGAAVPVLLRFLVGEQPSAFQAGMIDFLAICLGATVIAVSADHLKNAVLEILAFIRGAEVRTAFDHGGSNPEKADDVWQISARFLRNRLTGFSFLATCLGIAFAALTAKSAETVIYRIEKSSYYQERMAHFRQDNYRVDRTVIYQVVDFERSDDFLWRVRFPNARKRDGLSCAQALAIDPARNAFDSTVLGTQEEFAGQAERDRDRMLNDITSSIRSCPSGEIALTVQGYASNAPFAGCTRDQSIALNRKLATVRRDIVATWLEEHSAISVTPVRKATRYPSQLSAEDQRQSPNTDRHRSAVVRIFMDCPQ